MPRSALFEKAAEQIAADIESGAAVSDPSLLTRFALTCHADLKVHRPPPFPDRLLTCTKKYIFYYMFGFPALAFPGDAQPTAQPPVPLDHASSPFHGAAADELVNAYESVAFFSVYQLYRSCFRLRALRSVVSAPYARLPRG